ncbi:carbohydrate kinase family protein [Candidatus Protofrankia californiensis]|uniref:carbohydrate kinase family protein n=1 Tax=Candidatus Protofrankia californiensis TaxID=1839754 RepID=UPI0010411875|nr:PfkB family carbohydrate kinase [Candidatus Protofrankia californiensis]
MTPGPWEFRALSPVAPPHAGGGPRPRFVVVVSYVADCLVATSRLPDWGDDLKADGIRTTPGGKALNQAVTLARHGAHVTALGVVGGDAVGRRIRDALTGEGIDVTSLHVQPTAGRRGLIRAAA